MCPPFWNTSNDFASSAVEKALGKYLSQGLTQSQMSTLRVEAP